MKRENLLKSKIVKELEDEIKSIILSVSLEIKDCYFKRFLVVLKYFIEHNKIENLKDVKIILEGNLKASNLLFLTTVFGEDEGRKRFKEYKNSISNSLENMIKRYGEEEGRKRFEEFRKKSSKSSNINYYIEKYGEEEGRKKFEKILESKKQSLENMIKRYGEEEGRKKWESFCRKNSFSNTIEFYLEKYGEEEGRKKFSAWKKSINTTGIDYFLQKTGGNLEEAKKLQHERQSTFSLEKCIKKYGEDGFKIWKKRQDTWQESLNIKSQEEKDKINIRKNFLNRIQNLNPEEFLEECLNYKLNHFKNNKNVDLNKMKEKHSSLEKLKSIFIEEYKRIGKYLKSPSDYFDSQSQMFKKLFDKEIIKELDGIFEPKKIFKNSKNCHYLKVDEGLLRSSNEILFYSLLKEHNIKFQLDKKYPNSKMRYDFYLEDFNKYIEIAGLMSDETYREKMKIKEEQFGAIIIEPKDIIDFIETLI